MMNDYWKDPLYSEDLKLIADNERLCNAFSGKCIAVTGASGMIGTLLVDALMRMNSDHGTQITVLAMSRSIKKLTERFARHREEPLLKLIKGDITESFSPEPYCPDYIIHAASNTHPLEYSGDPIGTITTNIFGTWRILEWLKENKHGRLLLLSSVEIYGENRKGEGAFTEEDCGYINCNTLRAGYPESKRCSETMAQAYLFKENVDTVIVRLCRIYGPTIEEDDSKALSQFLKKGLSGEDIVLKSEGNQFYSYLYSADAVSALLYAAAFGRSGEAYNAASEDSNIRLKDLAEMIAGMCGRTVIFELPNEQERKGYSKASVALLDAGKLKGLGWDAGFSIRDGIDRTMKIISRRS